MLNIPPQRPVVTKEQFIRAGDLGGVVGERETATRGRERDTATERNTMTATERNTMGLGTKGMSLSYVIFH